MIVEVKLETHALARDLDAPHRQPIFLTLLVFHVDDST